MNYEYPMTTLSELMNLLAKRGISDEVRMNNKVFQIQPDGQIYSSPKDLVIIRAYRFEGDSNPSDNAVLYIIKDKAEKIFYLIDTYGAESNYDGPEYDDFLKEIPFKDDLTFSVSDK